MSQLPTERRCPQCGVTKPLSDFYGRKKLSGWCKSCDRQRSKSYYHAHRHEQYLAHRRWVEQNPHIVKAHKAQSAYGIKADEYERLMSQSCAVCGSTESLCIDHNHTTGLVRGVLCDACNKAIGFMSDNPTRLAAAARYLKPDIFAATYEPA